MRLRSGRLSGLERRLPARRRRRERAPGLLRPRWRRRERAARLRRPRRLRRWEWRLTARLERHLRPDLVLAGHPRRVRPGLEGRGRLRSTRHGTTRHGTAVRRAIRRDARPSWHAKLLRSSPTRGLRPPGPRARARHRRIGRRNRR